MEDVPCSGLLARELTEADARAIASWRYEPPFDCYNFPPWQTMVAEGWAVTIPTKRSAEFWAVSAIEQGKKPVGFFRLRPHPDFTELSCGLAPDLCGQGLGAVLVELAIREWRDSCRAGGLRLFVRPFNKRAIRRYSASGFVLDGAIERDVRGELTEFLRMALPADSPDRARRPHP